MKTSEPPTMSASVPSLFQIAAFFEDFFPAAERRPSVAPVSHPPVAESLSEYILNPEKLMTLLCSDRTAKSSAVAESKPQVPVKRGARGATKKAPTLPSEKINGTGGPNRPDNSPQPSLPKKVEFLLKSVQANSVKLAGDFTQWEKNPVEMMSSQDGIWFTVVPLVPGTYSYRYIVDGQWFDDPNCELRAPNPFGSQNTLLHVT